MKSMVSIGLYVGLSGNHSGSDFKNFVDLNLLDPVAQNILVSLIKSRSKGGLDQTLGAGYALCEKEKSDEDPIIRS